MQLECEAFEQSQITFRPRLLEKITTSIWCYPHTCTRLSSLDSSGREGAGGGGASASSTSSSTWRGEHQQ